LRRVYKPRVSRMRRLLGESIKAPPSLLVEGERSS